MGGGGGDVMSVKPLHVLHITFLLPVGQVQELVLDVAREVRPDQDLDRELDTGWDLVLQPGLVGGGLDGKGEGVMDRSSYGLFLIDTVPIRTDSKLVG